MEPGYGQERGVNEKIYSVSKLYSVSKFESLANSNRSLISTSRARAMFSMVSREGALRPHSMKLTYLGSISTYSESCSCDNPQNFRSSLIRAPSNCLVVFIAPP